MNKPCDSKFLAWINRNHHGFYASPLSWNWKISGVHVTLWMQTGLVKIYHDEGRHTECHPSETERCRESVMELTGRGSDRMGFGTALQGREPDWM